MNQGIALKRLAALSQATRLKVFRLLVRAGAQGVAAGALASRAGVSAPALSFHAKELVAAGLVQSRQEGRYVIYSADYAAMDGLLAYLTDNCCGGEDCGLPTPQRRGTSP
ncbi:MAG: helix-turn-helix transcriptional regulator [Steroidobacteraceae bacterium]|nr:helix-turn-helix transcriptional regulator [Steroidobacteraceae bacterium]MCC7198496.1 helix-turn-helix transcriptional regulator [Gammaproteobacteria bacterium]